MGRLISSKHSMADTTIGLRELRTVKIVWQRTRKIRHYRLFLAAMSPFQPRSSNTFAHLISPSLPAQGELDAILQELKATIRDHRRFVRAVAVELYAKLPVIAVPLYRCA